MTIEEARAQFPHIDMIYARKHGPKTYAAAERYNAARADLKSLHPVDLDKLAALKQRAIDAHKAEA